MTILGSLGRILERDASFFTHGSQNRDNQFLSVVKFGLDLRAHFTFGQLDVVLGGTIAAHQGQETVVDIQQRIFGTVDVGDIHVVSGRRNIFQLLASEDVNGDHVDLGVTVLASLGGRHIDNLTGTTLDDNVTVLSQGRTLQASVWNQICRVSYLHRVGQRRTGSDVFKSFVLFFFSHDV